MFFPVPWTQSLVSVSGPDLSFSGSSESCPHFPSTSPQTTVGEMLGLQKFVVLSTRLAAVGCDSVLVEDPFPG